MSNIINKQWIIENSNSDNLLIQTGINTFNKINNSFNEEGFIYLPEKDGPIYLCNNVQDIKDIINKYSIKMDMYEEINLYCKDNGDKVINILYLLNNEYGINIIINFSDFISICIDNNVNIYCEIKKYQIDKDDTYNIINLNIEF